MSVPRGLILVLAGPVAPTQGAATLRGSAISMSRLASTLRTFAGRQVIDKTGLTGLFDMSLKFSTEGMFPKPGVAGAPVAAEPVPSLFSAIQELGLRLEQARGPVQVVVIDSVQKPSEN